MKMTKIAKALSVVATVALAGVAFQVQAEDAGSGKPISALHGKCGDGKCGTKRVRAMMDGNNDGMISKDEYMSWSNKQAAKEFAEMSQGGDSASPRQIVDAFLRWEEQGDQGKFR